MKVVCGAIIGHTSQPLYLETFEEGTSPVGDALTFQYLVHASLDGVEEKMAAPRKPPQQAGELFIGPLYSTEDYHVYGYVTNTRIKIIAVVDEVPAKEEGLRTVLRCIHAAYVDAVSNPFYEPGQPLTSTHFDSKIKSIIASANAAVQAA